MELRADLDQIEALAGERDALWARLQSVSFLTDDEKRAAAGYGAPLNAPSDSPAGSLPEGAAVEAANGGAGPFVRADAKYREDQPRVPAGSGREKGAREIALVLGVPPMLLGINLTFYHSTPETTERPMAAAAYTVLPATHTQSRFVTPLDLKFVAEDGAFEGYASLFNREDLGRDVIAPGAFRDSLAKRGAAGIKMLFQHNPAEPIGVWDEIREDDKGLYARGHLLNDVVRAREVLSLMRAGALDGLSIGFKAEKARRDAKGVRRIEKIDLWEISIVTFPMLPEARVAAVKQRPFADKAPTEREFERWLTRDAGLTRMQARAILRDGFKGLKALRDWSVSGDVAGDDDAMLAARIRATAERLMQAN